MCAGLSAFLKHKNHHRYRGQLQTPPNASGTVPNRWGRYEPVFIQAFECQTFMVNIFPKSCSDRWEAGHRPHHSFQLQTLILGYQVPDDRGRTNDSPYKLYQVQVVTTKIILLTSRKPSKRDYKNQEIFKKRLQKTIGKRVNLLDCQTMSSPQRHWY